MRYYRPIYSYLYDLDTVKVRFEENVAKVVGESLSGAFYS